MVSFIGIKCSLIFSPKTDIILFGRESKGVPEYIHKEIKNKLKIPISNKTRSLNVAISASITAAEALRQTKIF